MIQETPDKFIVHTNHTYPPFNDMIFEDYFYHYFTNNKFELNRIYLPVLWTNFYLSRNNGDGFMDDLQEFLNSLDRSKKYFTVLQYDDGILQNISDLDIKIYGAGGGGAKNVPQKNLGQNPIPLLCKPSPHINKTRPRNILASFVGALNNRHVVRDAMVKEFKDKDGVLVRGNSGYQVFADMMERSLFALCPRGYGATSFRICEALQYGTIPVYIYDRPWIPWKGYFNFEDIGILCDQSQISSLYEQLKNVTDEQIRMMRENGKMIYLDYFDYNGCSKKIIKTANE